MIMLDRFEDQRKKDQQNLFREREVQNLRDLIYGEQETSDEFADDSIVIDTNRYDVHHSKLEVYL